MTMHPTPRPAPSMPAALPVPHPGPSTTDAVDARHGLDGSGINGRGEGRAEGQATDDEATPLLQFVDFKWLMAGEGHRIDLGRLQNDRAYARGCLSLALSSTSPTLRDAAQRLGRQLSVVSLRA